MPKKKRWTQIERTAYHEAGHAVMAYLRKRRLTGVTIVCTEQRLGECSMAKWPKTDVEYFETGEITEDDTPRGRTRRETLIMIYYAGVIAEEILTSKITKREVLGASGDLLYVEGLMGRMWMPNTLQAEHYLLWLWYRTKGLLEIPMYWAAVDTLAATLLDRKKLGGRKARETIDQAMHDCRQSLRV